MEPVDVIEGKVSVLDRADVDTDQIIPKQFLKRVERTGFGEFLFYDWIRDGEIELEPNPILVAGRNFGCGSSREHAVVGAAGLRLPRRSIAPSFADIFYVNCTKNGLLPVILDEDAAARSPRPARRGSTSTTRPSTPPAGWSGSRSTRRSSTGSSHGLDDIGDHAPARGRDRRLRGAPAARDRGPVTTALRP